MAAYVYPENLLQKLPAVWNASQGFGTPPPALPGPGELSALVDVAYHASFLTEEQRRLGFRLVYASSDELGEYVRNYGKFHHSLSVSPLSRPLPLTASELIKLAPATDYTRMLICVAPAQDRRKRRRLEIWGLLDAGGSWWSFTHGEGESGFPPPNFLTIAATEPGQLSVSRNGWPLLNLRHGVLSVPSRSSPIHRGPVSEFLEPARTAFYRELCSRLNAECYDPEGHDDDYPARFFNEYLERILFHIREKHHGGTLLVVPEDFASDDGRLVDLATVKYQLDYSRGWNAAIDYLEAHRRYYDIYFGPYSKDQVSKDAIDRLGTWESQMEDAREAVADSVRFVAALSAVDGALLMTNRLKLIGFGTEIIAASRIAEVDLSIVASGRRKAGQAIEAYGTRHRTAIRFCSRYEDAVAFIVSSDGGVKAVKRVGARVIMWPDINSGAFGL